MEGHRCGDVASVVEVGLARKAEESGQETFHMRVFVYVRTRLVLIQAEFSLGKDDPMAIVSILLLADCGGFGSFSLRSSAAPI